jgi:hypothetical protein
VPVSYADAFAKPVDPKNEEKQSDTGQVQRVDLRIESAKRLIDEANRITQRFDRTAMARILFTGGNDIGTNLEGQNTKDYGKGSAEAKNDAIAVVPFTPVDHVDELVQALKSVLGFPRETEGV